MSTAPASAGKASASPATVGALCMLVAVLCFTALDAIGKHLVVTGVPPLQAVWGRYAFSALPLLLIPLFSGWKRFATTGPGVQIARGVALITATAAMFTGLRSLQLADAYALSYISPFIVAALSRYVLREHLTGGQWAALALAFAGSVVVIRPAFAQAGAAIVFPLVMAMSYAVYQVLTRLARRCDDAIVCVFYAQLVGAALLTALMPFVWQPMAGWNWAWFLAAGTLANVGHWLLAIASNRVPPAMLAPLSYLQLLYAPLIDLTIFGTLPDGWTLVGGAIIMLGGFLLWRVAPRPMK